MKAEYTTNYYPPEAREQLARALERAAAIVRDPAFALSEGFRRVEQEQVNVTTFADSEVRMQDTGRVAIDLRAVIVGPLSEEELDGKTGEGCDPPAPPTEPVCGNRTFLRSIAQFFRSGERPSHSYLLSAADQMEGAATHIDDLYCYRAGSNPPPPHAKPILRVVETPQREPDAFAVRNDQGFWAGIWNDRESAENVFRKGFHGEQVVPMFAGQPYKPEAGGR